MVVTFSTCWYNFKSKYDNSVYINWMDNMLSNVNNYNLVIYSDYSSSLVLEKYAENPKIKIIIKPHNQFYTYKYRENWILNHEKNDLLKNKIDWKINMLWNEKINFVNETMKNKYFDTEFYGWCDIGYFRNSSSDLSNEQLTMWPSENKINELNKEKIYYACINNNSDYLINFTRLINDRLENGLPRTPIDPAQVTIAGGFFVSHKDNINWWHEAYYKKLELYFDNNYLVKDDQIIIVDCIFSNVDHFFISREYNNTYDIWFMYQRLLL